MALNFGLLDPDAPAKIAGSVYAGQQQRQQNELALQQAAMRQQEMGMRQQEFGLRQQEAARAEEDRKLKLANAERRQQFLKSLSTKMAEGGHKLDRPTLGQMLKFGMETGEDSLMQLATKGLQALDEQEQFQTEMGRLAPKAAPVAPAVSGTLGSGTFGITPAPANALAPAAPVAAAPTNALTGGYTRPQIEQMLVSPNARVREMGKNLLGALPKEDSRYNVPGVGLVDATGKVIVPSTSTPKNIANINPNDFTPASIQKFSQSGNYADLVSKKPVGTGEGAATKAPAGYRFTKSGDLEAIPGGPAAGKPLTELQQLKLKKDFAADTTNVKSSMTTADELEKLTDELVGNPDKKLPPHPGLSGITGWSALLPSAPSGNAIKAEQKLETFKGKIKALGRQLASQEGKLGNMAVQEWKMVSDAVQAIDPRAGNLDVQMRDVVRQARDLAGRMQEKFDLTYEDQTRPATPATPPAVVPDKAGGPAMPAKPGANLTPAEQAELEQLRQRFRK